MKNLFFWMLALLCLASQPNYAQNEVPKQKTKERYFSFGIGLQRMNTKDDAMSPVRYAGSSLGLNFGLQKHASKWLSRVNFSLSAGGLKSQYYEDTERGSSLNFRMGLEYSRLQKLKTLGEKNIDWFLGGHIGSFAGFRLHHQLDNSSGVYDSFTSLGISTAFKKTFEWKKRNFQLYYQANIPLVSIVLRPTFNGLFNFVDPESDFFKENLDNHGWASFGSYFRLNNRFELAYTTRGGQNKVMLGYQWDIYRYNKIHQMLTGRHQVSLSTLFYF